MQNSNDKRHRKAANISQRDHTLLAFTFANLLLMLNTGVVGLIKAIPNVNSPEHEPIPALQLGTDSSSLMIAMVFACIATAMNHTGRVKKHQEMTLKANKLQDNRSEGFENAVYKESKKALRLDKFFSGLSYFLIAAFFISTLISTVEKARGDVAEAALADVVGNSLYLLAMVVTIINKLVGDTRQSQIEKKFLRPPAAEAKHQGVKRATRWVSSLFGTINHVEQGETRPIIPQVQPEPSDDSIQIDGFQPK